MSIGRGLKGREKGNENRIQETYSKGNTLVWCVFLCGFIDSRYTGKGILVAGTNTL
jgi:hypothetical protein